MTAEPGKTYQHDPPSRCCGREPTTGLRRTLGNRRGFSAVALAKEEEYKQGATYPWDSVQIQFNGNLAAVNSVADGLLWTHLDHLGTPRIKTDSTGLVPIKLGLPDRDWYYPYGEQINTPVDAVTRRFTGQERDFESGLDYFGARHYSPSLGRFASPDSPSYSKLSYPQSWNLYVYTMNQPLLYVDPTGHEIVCSNNPEQCQRDAAAATGSPEAASRVSVNTVTSRHSFLGIHWTTSKTTISIAGDVKSFRALGQNASRLADLVEDKRTVSVVYDQYARPSFWAGGIRLNGGSTSYVPSQGYAPQAFIDPLRTSEVPYDPDATAQGLPQANTAEEFGHEVLGHIWGELNGGHPAGTRANMRDSIAGENAVRKLDPTRGQKGRESHHNYFEKPPDGN